MYGKVKSQLQMNDIPSALAKNVSYKIEQIDIDSSDDITYAIVSVNFSSVDMIEMISELNESDEYRKVILDRLNNHQFKEKNVNIKVMMLKIDDWYLYESAQLNDIFMGGLYSLNIAAQQEFYNRLNEGE